MSMYWRSDWTVQDGLGRVVSNASVYWVQQPANTSAVPPTPLVTLYNDSEGDAQIANPQITNGYGQVAAYMQQGIYTVVEVWNGRIQNIYPDQSIGVAGSGGGSVIAVGLQMPANTFSVAGSPITTSGSFVVTEITQKAGYDFTAQSPPVATPSWKAGYKKQVFNVLNYGADPTGATDSTSAFQNCINAACAYNPASQSTGSVYIPTGLYIISTTLVDTGQGIGSIFGDPGGTSILQVPNAGSTNGIFNFMNCNTIGGICHDLVFNGCQLHGRHQWCNRPVVFGLTGGDLQDWTFDNLRFFQWGGNALSLLIAYRLQGKQPSYVVLHERTLLLSGHVHGDHGLLRPSDAAVGLPHV